MIYIVHILIKVLRFFIFIEKSTNTIACLGKLGKIDFEFYFSFALKYLLFLNKIYPDNLFSNELFSNNFGNNRKGRLFLSVEINTIRNQQLTGGAEGCKI